MSNSRSTGHLNDLVKRFLRKRHLWMLAGLVPVAIASILFFGESEGTRASATTFVVRRGLLPITIVEGGTAESLAPQKVKCEVKARGGVKILSIVEEGYRITQEDIENKKALVRLDSAELEERIMGQELEYQRAKANLSEAQQQYEIQEETNESTIQAAEREVNFKAMDLQKYLGETVANKLIAQLKLRRAVEAAEKTAQVAETVKREADAVAEHIEAGRTPEKAVGKEDDAIAGASPFKDHLPVIETEKAGAADATTARITEMVKAGLADPSKQGELMAELAEMAKKSGRPLEEMQKEAMKIMGSLQGGRTRRARRPAKGPDALDDKVATLTKMVQMTGAPPDAIRAALASMRGQSGDSASIMSDEELDKVVEDAEKAADEAHEAAEEAIREVEQAAEAAGVPMPESNGGVPSLAFEFEPFNFRTLAEAANLAGEAEQKRRLLESDIMLEDVELIMAKDKLTGTRKLHEHDFVTDMQLRGDEIVVTRREIGLESKTISKKLFFRYTFPKEAEQAFSEYEEALRKLDRAKREATIKLMNAKVNMDATAARFVIQDMTRQDYKEQLAKSLIYATHEGLVVYGGEESSRYYGGSEPIREGALVREQQTILTIPDITQMSFLVPIHESSIKKVEKGQKARIKVEAFPDEPFVGEVTKVSVLPSSQRRWMNPDLKVYETTVSVEGVYEWLKPGMTAEVEILIEELHDVLYVPLQAVSSVGGLRVCYLASGDRRAVETGKFDDKYIEIKSGLEEDDVILLRPLEGDREAEEKEEDEGEQRPESEELAKTDSAAA